MVNTMKLFFVIAILVALLGSAVGKARGGSKSKATRILGGYVAEQGQWPFAVSLHRQGGGHYCGGTIISPTCVVSAGHCFQFENADPKNVYAVAGMTNKEDDSSNFQMRNLSSVHVHEGFKLDILHNDITVVRLSEPLVFTDLIQPAIPANSYEYTEKNIIEPGKVGTAIGWGNTRYTKPGERGALSSALLYVHQRLWSHQKCKSTVPKMGEKEGELSFHNGMICAGGVGGKDACQGDSGGPFVIKGRGDSNILLGAVSFGNQCGLEGWPGVYANVGYYYEWIKSKCPDLGDVY